MKKKISILILFTLILNLTLSILTNLSFASTKSQKKNSESYWSTKNAPLFYGTTKITLKKGILDEFHVLDTRFRIFARDFEDGDLTPKITYSENVKVDEEGDYEIIYQVKDSHNNQTTLTVPVTVTDDEDAKITVERTLYTTPSVWNMDLAEFSRCNYGDRQILGVYLSAGQSIQARVLSAENTLNVGFINNDQYNETSTTLPVTDEWITLENIKDSTYYDGVPLLKTTVLARENTVINKTFQIELQYDETIKPLDYYHYLDDEEEFRAKWIQSQNNYSVIESETLTLVVPFTDMKYMTNYYKNGFTSLDQFLAYYQKVVEKMDEYVGLDFNPEKITDQNVRTKYLIRANVHGVGAAYYAGDHVGVNNASMASFFEMNWGGLHELAHGYQGSLGKGAMQLGEVANNIIGHYIQIDKNIYFHQGNWLGNLSAIEEDRNSKRLAGQTFLEVDEPTRLYVIVNLLDALEGGTTYGKMFSWYRDQLNKGRTMTNQDAYVEAIAAIYQINILPYMEAWGLEISNSTKRTILEANYPLWNILKDMVTESTLQEIMTGENFNRKYGLVSNEILQKYSIYDNVSLNITIDDISKIQGKVILLKHGQDIIKNIKVENNLVELNSLPVGTYFLQMPVITGYSQEYVYIQVKESAPNFYTYTYQKVADVDYNNYFMFRLLGYNFNTIAYQLTLKDNYTKAEIRYPNQSSMSGNEYVKIYDTEGRLVTEDVSTGGYFDFNKGIQEIALQPGYSIEIYYPNKYASKVVAYSTLSNEIIPEYGAIGALTRYILVENGILREDMSEEDAEELAYIQLKAHLINQIEAYQKKVTKEELNNKFINFSEKTAIVNAYEQLREVDQTPFVSLITAIKQGGSPIISVVAESLTYEVGSQIDLYRLIKAVDNEDGPIVIDKNSTTIETKLNCEEAGNYRVTYKVSDSDHNVSTKVIEIEIIGIPSSPDEGEDEDNGEEIPPPSEGEDEDNDEENENEGITPPIDNENDKISPPIKSGESDAIIPNDKNKDYELEMVADSSKISHTDELLLADVENENYSNEEHLVESYHTNLEPIAEEDIVDSDVWFETRMIRKMVLALVAVSIIGFIVVKTKRYNRW